MNIVDINEKEAGAKLNLINKYYQIVLSIVFGTCIFYLYIGQIRLNDRYIEYIKTDNKNIINVISENTNVQKEVLNLNKELNKTLIENQTFLQTIKIKK